MSLFVSVRWCPSCGRRIVLLDDPKPPLPVQIALAIREADLAADDIVVIREAVDAAPGDITPRALAERVPAASKIITIASRAGKNWLGLLSVALAAAAIYVAHSDAQQAHRDAERAIREAGQPRATGGLSDEDVHRIARRVKEQLDSGGAEDRQKKPHPHGPPTP